MSTLAAKSVTTTSKASTVKTNAKEKKSQLSTKTTPAETPVDPSSGNGDNKLQPTAEQMRLATLMNDKTDFHELQHKVEKILELTGTTRDEAVVALHDCDNNLEKAVDMILEGDSLNGSEWQCTTKKKKPKAPAAGSQVDEESKHLNGERNRGGGGRGSRGAPRLQRGGPQKGSTKSKDDKGISENNETSEPGTNSVLSKKSDLKRGRGRMRGGPTRGGMERGRGSRTFQNKGLRSGTQNPTQTDGFINSIDTIDTWHPSTANQPNPSSGVGDCTTMTVGNWSDVAGNEDWSEEDWDSTLMETKVFTPSAKAFSEKEELTNPALDLSSLLQKSRNDPNEQKSNVNSAIGGNSNATSPGAALLQQLQQQQSTIAQPSSVNQYAISQYSKQATESIKSLVGIPSSVTYSSATNNNLSTTKIDPQMSNAPQGRAEQISLLVDDQQASQKPLKIQNKRPTKIPESAVEMPSNDSVSSLNVQFGALDFGAAPSSFNLGTGPSQAFHGAVNHDHQKSGKILNSQSATGNSDLSLLSSENTFRGSSNASDISRNKVHSDVLQNSVLGQQSMSTDNVIDRSNGSNSVSYGEKLLDSQMKKSTASMYPPNTGTSVPVSMKPQPKTTDLSGFKAPTYNNQAHDTNIYGSSSYGNVSTSVSYVYSSTANPTHMGYSTGSNYSSTFPSVTHSATGGISNQKVGLSDVDSSNTQKYENAGNSLGLVSNSTVTTNVLKNSLSATGKGIANVPPPGVTPLLGTQYIMGQTGMPAFLPYYDVLPATARDHNFAYPPNTDVKYSRTETDGTSVVSTQAPVSQAPIFGQLPPGYGFFYTPGAVNMMPQNMYGAGAPLFPVQPTANTGSSNSAFPKGSSGYGSHSYNMTRPPSDVHHNEWQSGTQAYGSTTGQSGKGMGTSNSADLTAANQIYGKNHAQVLNQKSGYEKSGFQTGTTPAPFNMPVPAQGANLGTTAYAATPSQYIQMLPHSQGSLMHHSLQADASVNPGQGVGQQRAMGGGNQKGGTAKYNNYNWGV